MKSFFTLSVLFALFCMMAAGCATTSHGGGVRQSYDDPQTQALYEVEAAELGLQTDGSLVHCEETRGMPLSMLWTVVDMRARAELLRTRQQTVQQESGVRHTMTRRYAGGTMRGNRVVKRSRIGNIACVRITSESITSY